MNRRILTSLIGALTLWVTCGVVACAADDGDGDAGPDSDTTSEAGTEDDTETEEASDTETEEASDTGSEEESDTPSDTGPTACADLVDGMNPGFPVNEGFRDIVISFPEGVEDGGPWPVVFNWHGFGDTAANMHGLLSGYVDDAEFPFILVTPDDKNMMPPAGMDWDVLAGELPNIEVALFDAVLTCLDERFDIDADRIHSVGFSAGAIATDLIGVHRPGVLASAVAYSGAYFSNPANVTGLLALVISWPAATAATYAQVILHGGVDDLYDLSVAQVHFDQIAAADTTYLNALGHDLVVCDHGGGHTVPFDFQGQQVVEFFAAHPRAVVDSPYAAAGLPTDFPDYCAFHVKD